MSFEPVWEAPIIWYLFLAGLGAGAFATASFLRWRHPQAVVMRHIAHIIAPIAVAIGLVLLMFDATAGFHDPLRFALLLTNPFSVMMWGVVFLSLFMVIACVALVMDFLKKETPAWLEIVGTALAVCVAIYTGVLLGVCRPYPLWNNALLPILFLVSALSSGAASVLLAAVFARPEEFNKVGVLKKFHFCFPLIELLLLASLVFITGFNSPAGIASVANLISGSYAFWFWIGLVLVGLVLPTALETGLLFFSSKEFEESRAAHALSAASDVGVLVGGFLLRFLIVSAAVPMFFL
ncbi:MAG: NrfD/PsrC family molybdoenzyme membrane anchor subunit [Gordonibacter sp.]|nr:NrfD/PsrC family molybdoenzyme membrane anchor subunit [Gordonibacter sp.]